MTLDEATPLISASAQLIIQLVTQIMQSVHMTDEEKDQAIEKLAELIEQTANKVENVRIQKPADGN